LQIFILRTHQQSVFRYPRIGDHDVQTPRALNDLRDRHVDRFAIGYIETKGLRLCSRRLDFHNHLLGLLLAREIVHEHSRPLGRKSHRDRPANPSG